MGTRVSQVFKMGMGQIIILHLQVLITACLAKNNLKLMNQNFKDWELMFIFNS